MKLLALMIMPTMLLANGQLYKDSVWCALNAPQLGECRDLTDEELMDDWEGCGYSDSTKAAKGK